MIAKVFLDANILYSGTCRSLFIWLYENRAIEIYWSQEVWDETFKNFAEKNNFEQTKKFTQSMQDNAIQQYSECMISIGVITPVGLVDVDDEHVVAGAKQCGANFIVTDDIGMLQFDFTSHGLVAMSADDFIYDEVIQKTPSIFVQAVSDHIKNLPQSRPKKVTYFESLLKSRMLKTNKWLVQEDEQDNLFDEIW